MKKNINIWSFILYNLIIFIFIKLLNLLKIILVNLHNKEKRFCNYLNRKVLLLLLYLGIENNYSPQWQVCLASSSFQGGTGDNDSVDNENYTPKNSLDTGKATETSEKEENKLEETNNRLDSEFSPLKDLPANNHNSSEPLNEEGIVDAGEEESWGKKLRRNIGLEDLSSYFNLGNKSSNNSNAEASSSKSKNAEASSSNSNNSNAEASSSNTNNNNSKFYTPSDSDSSSDFDSDSDFGGD